MPFFSSGARLRRRRGCAAAAVVVGWALGAWGQQIYDPGLVFRRAQERLLADLDRLPRYTCVQTITRRYYRPQTQGASCASLMAAHEKRRSDLMLRGWDRLRLEVAIAEGSNVYSWVGAPRFESDALEKLAGRGPLGSGDFGPFLNSILSRAPPTFQGEKIVNGRRLLEYAYEMPAERSRYQVKAGEGWTFTAFHGTFLLDPETADIAGLTVRTAELPESNPACQAISEVEYSRTQLHDRMVLIPRETRLVTIDRQGSETVSLTTYANCREYASKSRMVFENAPSSAGTTATPPPQLPATSPLPAGLRFDARLVTPIDSDTAAAGDAVEGVLRSAIRDRNKVLAPAGARLHGRLLRVERRFGGLDSFRIAVQFESLEVNGGAVPLRAAPDPAWSQAERRRNFPGPVVAAPDNGFADLGTFIFRTEHLRLKTFDWSWITVSSIVDGKGPGSEAR